MAETVLRVEHVGMRFNLSKERVDSLKEAGLFQKAKTFLIFRHFEIFLILFGTLYCKKG